MMISPECFAISLKDSSYQDLVKVRKQLLCDIDEFERHERYLGEDSIAVDPSPEIRYSMNLKYLTEVCKLMSTKVDKSNFEDDIDDSDTSVLSLDERKTIESKMESFSLSSSAWMDMLSAGTINIEIVDEDFVIIHARNFSGELDITSRLKYDNARDVISALHNLHTEEWIESFEPNYAVLDGYSWSLRVSSDEKYYLCQGDNACPDSLVNFLHLLSKYRIPVMWSDGAMLFELLDS